MRIAISGSHATGKSSLLSELGATMPGLVVTDEPYHLLDAAGHSFATPPTADEFEYLAEYSAELVTESRGSLVAFDRCPADYLAYRSALSSTTIPRTLLDSAASALRTLDIVIFVPVERPDRIETSEAPRLRRRVNSMLREMLLHDSWGFELSVMEVRGSLDDRVRQVRTRLATLDDGDAAVLQQMP